MNTNIQMETGTTTPLKKVKNIRKATGMTTPQMKRRLPMLKAMKK